MAGKLKEILSRNRGKSWLPLKVISSPQLLVDLCPSNKGKVGKKILMNLPRNKTRLLSSKIRQNTN